MRIEQRTWSPAGGWTAPAGQPLAGAASLVLVFGASAPLREAGIGAELRRDYPGAILLGCSTAGEIHGSAVSDDTVVATAIHFEHTALRAARVELAEMEASFAAGEQLARLLPPTAPLPDAATHARMTHVFVLSDGLHVNGSDLVRGLVQRLPAEVTITGGLAADAARFEETLVLAEGALAPRTIAAVAFYGERLRVGFGSLGGWDPFGPERVITRSKGNVLYELDGRSALSLYEQYLGEHARELPAAGLLFPLSLRSRAADTPVVRTILAIDRAEQSLTFAGDVPEGSYARLMKANFDRLIDGAVGAAQTGYRALGAMPPALALLISCVGRKLVLKQRVEEEVEGARDVLGPQAVLAGFYSYGEISPFTPGAKCELHNQTMTITTLSET
jgi:hypothetical protein